jgi:outer membrane receptor for ferrienterochelin and colicin
MPFNSLDLSIDIKLAKNLVLKAGIRNLLDDTIAYKQYEQFNKDITGDGIGDGVVTREELTRVYQPGRLFKIGLTLGL